MSFYAATKKANEAMAHSYAHLYNLPTTMFRFFTVYGPWGRPDMALFKFTKSILLGEPIDVYNHGNMQRDFTYIDDLVDGIVALIAATPERRRAAAGRQPVARRPLAGGQYRQFRTGPPARFHPRDRGRHRARGRDEDDADATRRRTRHLGRYQRCWNS